MNRDKNRTLTPKLRFPEFRDTAGWNCRAGNELFDPITNRAVIPELPVLAITQEHGAIPREQIDYHVSVTPESIASYKEVCVGDFIISLRSFQGGIEYSRHHGICSPAYVILRRKGEGSDDYFRYLFKTGRFIQQLTRNIEGLRDGKMITYQQFSEQLLPYPEPAEQQKIAEFLTSLDALIAGHTNKLEALRAQKTGLMQDLFPREGEAVPRLRFPEFAGADRWQESALADIATIRSGTTPSRAESSFYKGGTLPWVKTTDLTNSFIFHTEECITAEAKARVNPAHSVLVAMYGGFNQIGRTGYLMIPAATNQAISVLNTNRSEVIPIYLLVWLNAKVSYWRKIASSSRKDPNITGSDVARFPISYPSPLEQQKIADCLASIDELIAATRVKVSSLKDLKGGLMQQLFPAQEGGL